MKKGLSIVIIITLILCIGRQTATAYYSGYAGISEYGNCPYGDRAGAQYVSKLQNEISSTCTQYFMLPNAYANKYVFSSSWAYAVDFFAYSGHGVDRYGYNALHFRTIGNDANDHYEADHDDPTKIEKIEAKTTEIRLGGSLKYATFYTCNFLVNNGSTTKQQEIYKMFEGARLAMGFASKMYLDSREGKRYGTRLVSGSYTIVDAFITSAERYQTQRTDGDAIARVVGYSNASNDYLTDNKSVLGPGLWYINSSSSYSIITSVTIPHNGLPVLT